MAMSSAHAAKPASRLAVQSTPQLNDVSASAGLTTAKITWSTNEIATSQVHDAA